MRPVLVLYLTGLARLSSIKLGLLVSKKSAELASDDSQFGKMTRVNDR
jgi:hypothetical protein